MKKVDKTALALRWFDSGIFLDKSRSPNGSGFRLKLHEKNPDAPLSPFYLNFRILRSFPRLIADTAHLMVDMTEEVVFNQVADVPTAVTPLVTLVSHYTGYSMITPRELKTHGSGSNIDGVFNPGQHVALFDDLVTSGTSVLDSIAVLEAANLHVAKIIVLVDREQGGINKLVNAGYHVTNAFTISALLQLYKDEGRISADMYEEILDYLFG